MSEAIWQLESVSLGRGPAPRLRDVTLTIQPGVTAVVGWSGAGKTSLLNLLVGFEQPDEGRVVQDGGQRAGRRDDQHTDERADQRGDGALAMFWSPATFGLWPHLTVRQHLEAVAPPGARAQHSARPESIDALLAAFDLADRAGALPATLSQGESSRLAVARALAARPAVLVMDEPLAHVDPARVLKYWQVVRDDVKERGASLVFATHSPQHVLREAQRVVCLKQGRLLYEGDVSELYWRPATAELADCLGECNWLEPAEARLWLEVDRASPAAVRPEQIQVVPDERGPLCVQASAFAGSVAQVDLLHEPTGSRRRFFHRPASNHLSAGQRVVLRLLCLMLSAAWLSGCGGSGDAPQLQVKQVNLWPIPAAGNRLPAPRSVSIGPHDEVVVLDRAGRVLIFDPHGQLMRQWRMPSNKDGNPESACWMKDGRIAVADTHYYRVVFFDPQGQVLGTLGRHSEIGEPGTFRYPVSVVQDDEENLYVAEYGGGDRVQKFTKDGQFILQFGSVGTGPGQFQRAAGMAWHDGRVYIADASNGRVQIFTDKGDFVGLLGPPGRPLSFDFPYDVEIGPDDTAFVVEWGAGQVTRVAPDGRVLGRFGQPGANAGQFRTPWSIAVDSHMRVRIADTENRRIVELLL